MPRHVGMIPSTPTFDPVVIFPRQAIPKGTFRTHLLSGLIMRAISALGDQKTPVHNGMRTVEGERTIDFTDLETRVLPTYRHKSLLGLCAEEVLLVRPHGLLS